MNNRLPKTDGEVALLNVGEGDTKLSFDPKNPAERIRAARIVADMLKRGYALLIELPGGKGFTRCLEFKEDVCEYVIADFDPVTAAASDAKEEEDADEQGQASQGAAAPAGAKASPRRGRRAATVAVPAASARAVAVAPTAGG